MERETDNRGEKESLAALRDYVSKAVDEVVRLRAQNKALARRLSQLESDGGGGEINVGGISDPEELRSTITGFIDSIDRYLSDDLDGDDDDDG